MGRVSGGWGLVRAPGRDGGLVCPPWSKGRWVAAMPAWLGSSPGTLSKVLAAEPREEIPRGVFHLLLFANHFNGMGAIIWPGLAAVIILGWAFLAITGNL